MFKIHRIASQNVPILNSDSLRYALNSTKAFNIVKCSLCVLSLAFQALFKDYDQYSAGSAGPSDSSCNEMHMSCLSQSSVSAYIFNLVLLPPVSVVTSIHAVCFELINFSLDQSSKEERLGLFQLSFHQCICACEIRYKLLKYAEKTVKKLEFSLVRRYCSPCILLVAFVYIPCLPGCIT